MDIFQSFPDASEAVKGLGTDDEGDPTHVVNAVVLKTGEPAYWLTPVDTPETEIRDQAFKIRHGRDINRNERLIANIVREATSA